MAPTEYEMAVILFLWHPTKYETKYGIPKMAQWQWNLIRNPQLWQPMDRPSPPGSGSARQHCQFGRLGKF